MTLYDHDGNRIEPGAILNEHWLLRAYTATRPTTTRMGSSTSGHVDSGRKTTLSAAAFGKIERPYGTAGLTSADLRRGQWDDPARAAATASSRELTPRARKRRRMWFLTVSVLRWSSAAICFVECPCSRRRSTST